MGTGKSERRDPGQETEREGVTEFIRHFLQGVPNRQPPQTAAGRKIYRNEGHKHQKAEKASYCGAMKKPRAGGGENWSREVFEEMCWKT